MNCDICKTENPSWAWTDTHGVARCCKCGAPYRLYHYEGEGEATKIFAQSFGQDQDFFQFYRTMQAYKKTLTASGYQYMYLGDQLWGMTLAKAQAFCKKNGLTFVVAEEDNVMLMPSGTQGGPFNPKRMNLNIMSGKIVGVWPG